jgi:HSP20 family protein
LLDFVLTLKGVITMAETVPVKRAEKAESKRELGRPLPVFGEFPFFMSRLRDEFDRLFERISRDVPGFWGDDRGWRWGVDVRDEENAIVVRAEAPGFEPGDFELHVQDNRLTLKAARKSETTEKEGKTWRQQEYFHAVTLPVGIDKEKVEAKYHQGVLTVTLPKTPEGKGKRVPVKSS